MTVITKPSGIITKQVFVNPPQLEFEPNVKIPAKSPRPPNEEKVDIPTDVWPKRRVSNGLCCVLLWISLLVFLGLILGMMLYQQYVRPSTVRRYQGFCSVPIPNDMKENSMETNYRVLPLRWSPDPDVQIISTVDDAGEDFVNALREELDLGDMVEKISVINNGHRVNFIHDFNDNTTVRKRSAEDAPHDYMQFSGKHVLEIKIDNLPEILAYEHKIKGN